MAVKVKAWKGAWWLFIDHEGKRKAKRIGVGPGGKAAALKARADAELKLATGNSLATLTAPTLPTFAEYGRRWLDTVAAVQCRPSTMLMYETTFRVTLLPAFGALRLDAITREGVRALIARAHTAKRAANTIRRDVAVLSAILSAAIADRLIPANPAARIGRIVAAGADEVEEVEVFSAAELAKLLVAVQADAHAEIFYPFVLTLARTGMRLGEAVALEWRDVSLGHRILTVRRTATRHKGVTNAPKNGKARDIHVSRQLAKALASWQTLQAAEAAVAGQDAPATVFQSIKGAPINMTSFRENDWRRFLKAAGLAYRKPHVLRHTYASLLLAAGVPVVDVAGQLGHHSAGFTLRVYGHVIPRSDRRVADALDAAPNATIRNPGATAEVVR